MVLSQHHHQQHPTPIPSPATATQPFDPFTTPYIWISWRSRWKDKKTGQSKVYRLKVNTSTWQAVACTCKNFEYEQQWKSPVGSCKHMDDANTDKERLEYLVDLEPRLQEERAYQTVNGPGYCNGCGHVSRFALCDDCIYQPMTTIPL